MRKSPKQERAGRTIATIFEAAAQILQKDGADKLTTNRIAERAGFSIGTVYQYFPNKEAILSAIAERELRNIETQIRDALLKARPDTVDDVIRQLVRILIRAFSGRRRVRRFLILQAIKDGELGGDKLRAYRQMQENLTRLLLEVVERHTAAHPEHLRLRKLDDVAAFVVTRAIVGAIRAAVLEESPLLETQAFEDEIVRLATAYLRTESD